MKNSPDLEALLTNLTLSDIDKELSRRHLIDFTKYTFPQYKAEPAHKLIADTLDAVVSGAITRLMIFVGPQHGKSELATVRLPAYWFAKRPDNPIILTSYGASLAYSKSRQARAVVESTEYEELFPNIKTNPESRARDNWSIDGHRGELVAAGVGGPITGHGALLGLIDDPFENYAQAQSETIRNNVWEWYRTTFRTRIWEGGRIVIINTRWHEDDLCGRLLKTQGDQWQVLRLPAIAETQEERDLSNKLLGLPIGQPDPLGRKPGLPLCPLRFSLNALLELKNDVGSMAWYSQYQGVPRAPEGNRVKRAWFEIIQAAPICDGYVRYWDKAGTQGGGACTAGVLIGKKEGLYYILDSIRGQWSALEREKVILQTAITDRQKYGKVIIYTEQEPGSGGKESAENTIRNLAGFPIFADKVTGSKEVRAEPFIAQCEALNVKLINGKWNGPYIEDVISFPNGTYKDQMDASSGAFNHLVSRRRAKVIGARWNTLHD